MTARAVALAAVGLLALPGCKAEPQLSGVEQWNVNKTTLASADGRCTPTDFPDGRTGMWCFGQQPIGIMGMSVDIDLYFAGTEPTTPVIELQLKVRTCNEDRLLEWMRKGWGNPYQQEGKTFRWKNAKMLVAGYLPDEPGSCLLRMFPHRERAVFDLAVAP